MSNELSSPICTPDPHTNRIAYVSDQGGEWDIYVMNADGTCKTRLTHTRRSESDLAWSPDGTQILFRGLNQFLGLTSWSLYVMNADGSRMNLLARQGNNATWSPDGAQIAFVSDRDGFDALYVMNADGSQQRRLTDFEVGYGKPSWSPDGQQVVFYSVGEDCPTDPQGSDIYIANVDRSGVYNLTNNSEETSIRPIWSPDGRYILFELLADGSSLGHDRVCVMNADGTNAQCVLERVHYRVWGWRPNEKSISVEMGRWLYTIDIDCALESQLGDNGLPGGCWSRVGLPEGPLYPGGWSSDGELLVFMLVESEPQKCNRHGVLCDESEVYVMRVDGTGLTNLTDNVLFFDEDPTWAP